MCKNILISIIVGLIFYSINVKALSNIDTTLNSSVNDKNVIVTLNVKKANEGIDALTGKIEYDTSVFESLTIDEDGILKEAETVTGWEVPQYNTTTNEFVMTGVASSARDVMKINFKVKSGAKAGNTTISVKDVELSDGEKKLTKSVSKTLVINSSSSNNNNNSGNNNNNSNNNGNSSNNGNSNNNSENNNNNSNSNVTTEDAPTNSKGGKDYGSLNYVYEATGDRLYTDAELKADKYQGKDERKGRTKNNK